MSINLDDYFILYEKIDNFDNCDVDKWINSSKKPERLEKKIKKIAEFGGSFISNNYEVTSTDFIDMPFEVKDKDGKLKIQFGKVRTINFTPTIDEDFNENSETKSRISKELFNKIQGTSIKLNECKTINNNINEESVKIEECVNEDFINNVNSNYAEGVIQSDKSKKRKSKKRKRNESIESVKIEECVNVDFLNKIASTDFISKNKDQIEIFESVKAETCVNEDFLTQIPDNDQSITEIINICESNSSSNKRKRSISPLLIKEENVLNDSIELCNNLPTITQLKKKKKKLVVDNHIGVIDENDEDIDKAPEVNNHNVDKTEKKKKKKTILSENEVPLIIKKERDEQDVKNNLNIPKESTNNCEINDIAPEENNHKVDKTEKKNKKKKTILPENEVPLIIKQERDEQDVENNLNIPKDSKNNCEIIDKAPEENNHNVDKTEKKKKKKKTILSENEVPLIIKKERDEQDVENNLNIPKESKNNCEINDKAPEENNHNVDKTEKKNKKKKTIISENEVPLIIKKERDEESIEDNDINKSHKKKNKKRKHSLENTTSADVTTANLFSKKEKKKSQKE